MFTFNNKTPSGFSFADATESSANIDLSNKVEHPFIFNACQSDDPNSSSKPDGNEIETFAEAPTIARELQGRREDQQKEGTSGATFALKEASFKFEAQPSAASASGFISKPISCGFTFGTQDAGKTTSTEDPTPASRSPSMSLKSISISTASLADTDRGNPLFNVKPNTLGFGDLAKTMGGDFQFGQKDPLFKGFSHAGEHLFLSHPVTPCKGEEDKAELVTGEEDEQEMYSQCVKLYRFDSATSQWKERGAGNLKLMKNTTNGKQRVLMRREHVLNVCANHLITKTMSLKPLAGSKKAWMWLANDFSDGHSKLEQLAARFKTPELAQEFKQMFEDCQSLSDWEFLGVTPVSSRVSSPENSGSSTSPSPSSDSRTSVAMSHSPFEFGLLQKTVGTPESSPDTSVSCFKAKDGAPPVQASATAAERLNDSDPSTPTRERTFGTFGSLSFTDLAKSNGGKEKQDLAFGKQDSSIQNPSILWTNTPYMVFGASPAPKNGAEEEASDKEEASNNADIHFEPLVSLQEVDTKSGEEDEEILFKERTKLYRWDRDLVQWKERGVGDIKILFHPVKHFYRVLMRCEQVLRVRANHIISQAMELKPMNYSANAFVWTALDYAEGEGRVEQLAARFKTPELSESFRKTFCECQKSMGQEDPEPEAPGQETPEPEILGEEVAEPQDLSHDVMEPQTQDGTEPQSVGKEVPEPQTLGEEIPEPQTLGQETPEPQFLGQATPEPQTLDQETLEPQTLDQETLEPKAPVQETQELDILGEEVAEPQSLGQETPQPQSLYQETPEPQTLGLETPEPQIRGQETPEPQSLGQETPEPQTLDEEVPQPQDLGQEATAPQALVQDVTERQAPEEQNSRQEIVEPQDLEQETESESSTPQEQSEEAQSVSPISSAPIDLSTKDASEPDSTTYTTTTTAPTQNSTFDFKTFGSLLTDLAKYIGGKLAWLRVGAKSSQI